MRCGQKTGISNVTNGGEHYLKGEPLRYVRGHRHHADLSEIEAYKREWLEVRPEAPYGRCRCGCGQKPL